jgi:uncharacterized protein
VHMLEGIGAYVHGDPFTRLEHTPVFGDVPPAVARVAYPVAAESYRYCTEALVRGASLPGADVVKAGLRERGDSLIVIRGAGVLKVHVHTDEPDVVFAYLRTLGTLATHKAEDMVAQHAAVERASARGHVQLARRPVSIVTDSGCDLPGEVIRAHGIHVVPLIAVFEDGALRDGVDIDAETFVRRIRASERPTTSQPPPQAFLDAFGSAAEDDEAVLAVILSSALSGTYASAEAAARRVRGFPVVLVDSLGASLTQGLLVLRATELAELGREPHDIAGELSRIRSQSGLLFTVDVFDNLLASGRVGRGQVFIAGLLDIRPILGLTADGRIEPVAKVRGRGNVAERMLAEVAGRVPDDAKALRFGVTHVGCAERAEEFAAMLRARFGEREIITGPASPALATHLGPGAWGVAYQLED